MLRVVIARQRLLLTILISIVIAAGCGEKVDDATFEKAQAEKLARKHSNATIFDGEKHFANITQISSPLADRMPKPTFQTTVPA